MSKNILYFLPFLINQFTKVVLVVRKSGHLHQLPTIEASIKTHTLALIFPSCGFSRLRYEGRETTTRRIFVYFMSVTRVVTNRKMTP